MSETLDLPSRLKTPTKDHHETLHNKLSFNITFLHKRFNSNFNKKLKQRQRIKVQTHIKRYKSKNPGFRFFLVADDNVLPEIFTLLLEYNSAKNI